jgi:hypothetical protein
MAVDFAQGDRPDVRLPPGSVVWIERGKERPWLITPERAEEFVAALTR